MQRAAFDPRDYWERRLAGEAPAEAVGYAGLGAGLNGWMSRVRDVVFRAQVAPELSRLPSRRVLDVGSGTGIYLERWRRLGFTDVVGTDIADSALERLRQAAPGTALYRFTLGEPLPEGLAGQRFGAISAMDVLFHVLGDEAYRRAFETLFGLLEPGGLLVFSENFLHGRELRAPHQRSRELAEIERVVRGAGFEILRRRPLFVLMNHPHDSSRRVHRAWWRVIAAVAKRSDRAGDRLGALLFRPELALVSRLREGPSTELMLCRRPGP